MATSPLIAAVLASLLTACAPRAQVTGTADAMTATQAFRPGKLHELDLEILTAISNKAAPGAVLWIERHGASYHRAYGNRAVLPDVEPMTEDTLFDAASLTKVMATTPAVMKLIEDGRVDLDAPARTYLPEFTGNGRDDVTVRHLLTHTSGLRPGIPLRPDWSGYEAGIRRALAEQPQSDPGTRFRYSDVNFILLGELVRRVSGQPLDVYCAEHIYKPLGMTQTGFLPSPSAQAHAAPTTEVDGRFLRGIVHDPTARRMGGVAGHAGLFTTAADTARFARAMFDPPSPGAPALFKPETIRLMTSVQTDPALANARRGLGWDIDSPYAGPRGEHFPVGSFGHTGWTGTSLWIDPFSRTFVILMSNRNHPTEDGSVIALRRRVGTLAAESVEGFNFAGTPGALPRQDASAVRQPRPRSEGGVRNGIDVLAANDYEPLRNLRIGLITNHTGSSRERDSTVRLLHDAPGVELVALFSPEHGIRGELDDKVPDGTDPATGLPVYSLYGENRRPRPEHLEGIDALVFDIQDIGCRFYTYISTMGHCMEAAAEAGLRFVVLDRVNPINGTDIDGPVALHGDRSFVAFHPIPLRHGMTTGELARMFAAELEMDLDLTVVPVEGWSRRLWFDETGLPWINTSPNMRNLKEAMLYPGVGLLEFSVSVGRGTDTPFEVVGAPYVDDRAFAAELNKAGLPGIRFVPVRFTPAASIFKDQPCGGVYLLVTERETCNPIDVGITLALTLQRMHPGDFAIDRMQTLLRHPPTLEAIRAGKSLREVKALWASELGEFQARRGPFLLY